MNMPSRLTSLLTLHEVANYLQVSDRTVRRLIEQRKLLGIKIGSQWRFHKKEVDRIAFAYSPGGTNDT